MSAALLLRKFTGCSQYVEGTRIKFVAPAALMALIAACAETTQVAEVIAPPTGSFIKPNMTLGLPA
jgi:hypothetical protein